MSPLPKTKTVCALIINNRGLRNLETNKQKMQKTEDNDRFFAFLKVAEKENKDDQVFKQGTRET